MFERYRQPLFLQVKSIRLCAQWHNAIDFTLATCGRSAVGSAEPCQGSGRRFEPGRPLHKKKYLEKFIHIKLGRMAERRGSGLQIPLHGFKSRSDLQIFFKL